MKPNRRKLTQNERQEVYEKCGGHCAYCGEKITMAEMQVDHVQPLNLQGEDAPGNYLPACRSCNHYKHTLTIEKFREAVERWPEVLARDSVTYRNAVRFGLIVPNPGPVEFYFEREREGGGQ